jgi:prepilin-type N-terminal cleavage/methylation domain-containing protein
VTGRRRSPAGDAGFTLIELLVAMVILGVITTALGAAVISWLRHSDATQKQLELSHDVQVSAAHFARDVSAMGTRDGAGGAPDLTQSVQTTIADRTCTPPDVHIAWVGFLADRWDMVGGTGARSVDVVVYYLTDTGGGVAELRRSTCRDGGGPTPGILLARNVAIDPDDPADSWALDCSSACDGDSPPRRVTLSFTVAPPAGAAAGAWPAPNPIPVTLIGERRQT